MFLERKEFLGDRRGRSYKINTEDEREITYYKGFDDLDEFEQEDAISDALDAFEDGYNQLEEIDGQWYETGGGRCLTIRRKAYDVK